MKRLIFTLYNLDKNYTYPHPITQYEYLKKFFEFSICIWIKNNPNIDVWLYTDDETLKNLNLKVLDYVNINTDILNEHRRLSNEKIIDVENNFATGKLFVYKDMNIGDIHLDTDCILWGKYEEYYKSNVDIICSHIDNGVSYYKGYNTSFLIFNNIKLKEDYCELFNYHISNDKENTYIKKHNLLRYNEIINRIDSNRYIHNYRIFAEQSLLYEIFKYKKVSKLIDDKTFKEKKNLQSKIHNKFTHIWLYKQYIDDKFSKKFISKLDEMANKINLDSYKSL